MISIRNDSTDPRFNLALEEYALKYLDPNEEYVILWQNEPSIIVGRNQNTVEEINAEYVKKNKINVVRRLSGGGAVYHDWGNLNFTFIVKSGRNLVSNYKKFTEPVIKALNRLGVQAEFSGRNDITIDDKKFSGNAQYYYKDRLLHHGTLLYDSELSVLQDALNVKTDKFSSKGIKSVRSRVTNIASYLENVVPVQEFKDILVSYILEDSGSTSNEYELTDRDKKKIHETMEERYAAWEWNYGRSPNFNMKKSKRYAGGLLDIRLNVHNGLIQECKLYGDFLSKKDVTDLIDLIKESKYDEDTIRQQLQDFDLNDYLGSIALDEFIDCLFY
ncbi:lipoyltransferase and lipoate-protein ligase [Alkaliphilus metalliredigens QYMF]|uniref:lipoate--protein ligase n=1 Tax=Alkaliphilus metalliredigens (strain QYMF) TaxID=293826 RepID=A6TT25_ALKMQ|nr:lipoate--protein ligase [Alkaliphilus metalliredigens]ABR49343.1 lipoyltransferase and lipoate-protein ligase [Alkaliphilus metalliredigens QYMF]